PVYPGAGERGATRRAACPHSRHPPGRRPAVAAESPAGLPFPSALPARRRDLPADLSRPYRPRGRALGALPLGGGSNLILPATETRLNTGKHKRNFWIGNGILAVAM